MNTPHDIVNHAAQEASHWLNEIIEKLPGCDRHQAYAALRATLHALRDRIGPENAVHFGAQLPTLIRGIYFEGWRMAGTPTRERDKQAFLFHVAREMVGWPAADIESAVRCVFDLLWEKIDLGEIDKVMELLPHEIRVLWQKDRSAA